MVDKTRHTQGTITITLLGSNRRLRIKNTQNRDDIPISLYSSDELLYRPTSPSRPGYSTVVTRGTPSLRHPAKIKKAQARSRQFKQLRFFLMWLIFTALIYCVLTSITFTYRPF